MARLHNKFIEFNEKITLTDNRKEKLEGSIEEIKRKILKYFNETKPNQFKIKFKLQGSFEMDTTVNPIPTEKGLEYDIDCGVYFVGSKPDYSIDTLHSWISNAVQDHTMEDNKSKTTCVRVMFADGHHIDLPIYYEDYNNIRLAHKVKGWIESSPVEFAKWVNTNLNKQAKRIVKYLKAWKNFREINNTNLKFPSGFVLTILVANNYVASDFDDESFLETIKKIKRSLDLNFQCLRPTTPKGEDLFKDFSPTRKNDFLNALNSLIENVEKADFERNFLTASEYLKTVFGDRFPKGDDSEQKEKVSKLASVLTSASITPKPYAK